MIHIDERCTSLWSLGLTIRQKDRNPTWLKACTGLDYFGSCQNAGARQLDGYGMVFSFIPKLDSSSMSLGFIKVGNHSWLVVKKPSWKMMEFVNGKDDIPYMIWKIKFMFETTNQIAHSVTIPKTPGFTFLRPTFWRNIRKQCRTGIHQDLRPDVGIVTRMTCNHKNKPANFLPAMLLIHMFGIVTPKNAPLGSPLGSPVLRASSIRSMELFRPGKVWHCRKPGHWAAMGFRGFRSFGQKLGNSLNGKN